MSRLHIFASPLDEIARQFDAQLPGTIELPAETTEGAGGMAIIEHKGRRFLKPMDWGFPRFTRESLSGEELPGRIGLVADLTNRMWEQMVVDPRYRCIIPISHFANPDGAAGRKTRTWFSVKGQPVMAWAGFCRNIIDYGPVYAGMTMTANPAVMPTNDRMPVLLDPHEYQRWFQGSIQDVIAFQFREPFGESRMEVERTEDLWRSGTLPISGQPQLSFI
ncbi:MAG: DUF159 family protein [Sphingobium sp.]|nr:MAG: DUF159 family protein [Sphingobium sp.]PZU67057.1 MAG: DUF159 family protein [Rhizobium sp.]